MFGLTSANHYVGDSYGMTNKLLILIIFVINLEQL